MSCIGEARGFGKAARELAERLRAETLTPEERAKLEKDRDWYAAESRFCWEEARREQMEDEG